MVFGRKSKPKPSNTPSPEAQRLLAEAAKDYADHQAKRADGSADADHRSNMIAAQRQANRLWGKDKQPHGDDD